MFDGGALRPDRLTSIEEIDRALADLSDGAWLWVDAIDPSEEELRSLQGHLDLHDLAVEDVRHRGQRAKVEPFPDHVFAVLRPLSLGPDGLVESELFAFASRTLLVTLRSSPAFDMREAIVRWSALSKLAPGTGSALYAVADEIADDYLEIVEALEDRADRLEDLVFRGTGSPADRVPLQVEVLQVRRDTIRLRRHAIPMRQAMDRLADASELVTQELTPYLRDISDHLLRTIELTDGIREVLGTIVDVRAIQASNQLNEDMKKLSAWAGIVLVPTLIAGVYGMNFAHMPELDWLLGYPTALAAMALSAVLLYVGFRRRGWL